MASFVERERAQWLLSAIVDSSDDAIISKDLDGVITSWNKSAERVFGYSAGEVIGKPVTILIPADRLEEEPQILARLKRGERVEHFETIRRTKEGRLLEISLTISPIRDDDGHIIGASKIARDITQQKRIEADLKRANQDLEQFAFSASHDLQEPLRTVKLHSELLWARYASKLDGEALRFLKHVRDGGARMESLLRDLLAYAQSSNSEVEPLETIAADEILAVAVQNLTVTIVQTRAQVTSEPLPTVRMHGWHLQQLFQNLIGNALKYQSPDEAPRVHVTGERRGDRCFFSVRDNGIGIEREYQENIFGIFKRLHTREEYSGNGIGLAICERIVAQYHGRIWVESELGSGSTFHFTILG